MTMPLTLRLGLFYGAIFIGTGVSSPYMPVWFAHHGMSGSRIGLILSLPMMARVFTAPLLALWADSFKLRRTALLILALGVTAAYAAMAAPGGFGWQMVVWFAASSMVSTLPPLADVITLRRARIDGFNFGWPRGIGSAAFIVGNIGMGALLTRGSADLVLVWMVAAIAATAAAARFLLPPDPVHEAGEAETFSGRMAGLSDLLRDAGFMTAVVSAGLIQSAHAFYYSFSTLAWKQCVANIRITVYRKSFGN